MVLCQLMLGLTDISHTCLETPEAKMRAYSKLNPLVTAGPKIKSTMVNLQVIKGV